MSWVGILFAQLQDLADVLCSMPINLRKLLLCKERHCLGFWTRSALLSDSVELQTVVSVRGGEEEDGEAREVRSS